MNIIKILSKLVKENNNVSIAKDEDRSKLDLSQIDDKWIMIITAIFNCGFMCECPNVNRLRREMALPFRQERKKRKLKKISVYDDLDEKSVWMAGRQPPEPLPKNFDFKCMSDDEVKIWCALGAEIMDYSCLGYGVRKYINSIWIEAEDELDRRKVTADLLCDLKI